jgi:hypothetical protein
MVKSIRDVEGEALKHPLVRRCSMIGRAEVETAEFEARTETRDYVASTIKKLAKSKGVVKESIVVTRELIKKEKLRCLKAFRCCPTGSIV